MGHKRKLLLIAEIGCNHMGDFALAKELIATAKRCNADFVKFQKRDNRVLLPKEAWSTPHPVPENAFGHSYGAHREALEFDIETHRALIEFCKMIDIGYSCSVWDLPSALQMADLIGARGGIKIPSAANLNFEMQAALLAVYPGPIHLSLGMTSRDEIAQIIAFYRDKNRLKDVTLYICTSGYPVAVDQTCLLEISDLMQLYGTQVAGFGLSGHHLGGDIDIAALAIGRAMQAQGFGYFTHIERHFTLDHNMKGTDHAASLEPDEFAQLSHDLRALEPAFMRKAPEILPIEQIQRDKLKRPVQKYITERP